MKNIKQELKKILPNRLYYFFLKYTRRCFSQFGQDLWVINEVFNKDKNRYFVEIGSADGVTFNNTLLLENSFIWQGICIEANPNSYNELIKNRKCITVNKCLSNISGKKVLFQQYGLDSGIFNGNEGNISDQPGKIIEITTETLLNVLRDNNAPIIIDYLSIDVEGEEENILLDFPFDQFKFLCMTIERPSDKLHKLLISKGYIKIKEIPGVDVFYIHSDLNDDYRCNLHDYYRSISKRTII